MTNNITGLRFLGRHVYEAKQNFELEAETLYRDKVLIKRERTRDLMPLTLNTTRLNSDLAKIVRSRAQTGKRRAISLLDNKREDYHNPVITGRNKFDGTLTMGNVPRNNEKMKIVDFSRQLHQENVR